MTAMRVQFESATATHRSPLCSSKVKVLGGPSVLSVSRLCRIINPDWTGPSRKPLMVVCGLLRQSRGQSA